MKPEKALENPIVFIVDDDVSVRESLEAGDKSSIEAKAQALTQSMMKLGEAAYKAQQSAGEATASDAAAADATSHKPADGDVVDATFEEVKDEKK